MYITILDKNGYTMPVDILYKCEVESRNLVDCYNLSDYDLVFKQNSCSFYMPLSNKVNKDQLDYCAKKYSKSYYKSMLMWYWSLYNIIAACTFSWIATSCATTYHHVAHPIACSIILVLLTSLIVIIVLNVGEN